MWLVRCIQLFGDWITVTSYHVTWGQKKRKDPTVLNCYFCGVKPQMLNNITRRMLKFPFWRHDWMDRLFKKTHFLVTFWKVHCLHNPLLACLRLRIVVFLSSPVDKENNVVPLAGKCIGSPCVCAHKTNKTGTHAKTLLHSTTCGQKLHIPLIDH